MRDQDGPPQCAAGPMQSLGVDHDAGCLDDNFDIFADGQIQTLNGAGGDRGDDLDTGSDLHNDLSHDHAFCDGLYFSFQQIACAECHDTLPKQEKKLGGG